ncbi:ribosomal protein S13 [Hamiltosporidium tvaerminnensis]|uniref:Ribosomal protein S13 n=2 Tax=Hamiltosporidium TaxID=1176354 RepID=A0A4Q9L566_9MICR|nr:ribosomal 40S subunit protein S18B [Hamiltosporidium tvaerminnensis]TBU02708.1 ribosomal protein S13 [Hamiltosporidium magnivora]TBU05539.1 ribosomal protein S13 [Hamiltosporidium magnivora]TBU05940.1 ribosomal protein S13 [Hamiltosporidium magnivora]TBU13507.1 ribosomal protein S13 [Hamiltosporidium tvaerminnensis]
MSSRNFLVQPSELNHIIRLFNTNINGTSLVTHALTKIKGIGRRYADAAVKMANIDPSKRAGELNNEELNALQNVITDPLSFGIPEWFLNHQKDYTDGTTSHLIGNQLDADIRLLIERGKKIKNVRVCRLAAGLKVRGQRTKSNGRRGRTVGVSKKK